MALMKDDEIGSLKPLKGWVFGEAILGKYETESGILVITNAEMKRNPSIQKIKVLKVGPPYTIKRKKKTVPAQYWTSPGDTIWMRRGHHWPMKIGKKVYCFVHNDDITGVLSD